MISFESIQAINQFVLSEKAKNKTIGFVPTMGALHQGHLSLIQKSKSENDITIVSIFVNPIQFNNSKDFDTYPLTVADDIQLLKKVGCDALFIPSILEVYPNYPKVDYIKIELNRLNTELEAEFRPGHFTGVATILNILFNAIPANKAYFGIKDFQQLLVIKQLVLQRHIKVDIVACETQRELDGLAMSSRNIKLSELERKDAHLIYKSLCYIKANYLKKDINLINSASKIINVSKNLRIEYLKIVNLDLEEIDFEKKSQNIFACIAVYAGTTRLIDNIEL